MSTNFLKEVTSDRWRQEPVLYRNEVNRGKSHSYEAMDTCVQLAETALSNEMNLAVPSPKSQRACPSQTKAWNLVDYLVAETLS